MQTLISALECHLGRAGVQIVHDKVISLQHVGSAWQVTLGKQMVRANGVVLAVPAAVASPILTTVSSKLSAELKQIEFAGAAIVSLGFHRQDITHPLTAAGMIVPRIAGKRILAASFSSSKFAGRAPDGSVLIRAFIGGALDAGVADLTDDEVLEEVLVDLKTTLGLRGRPIMVQVDRWHTSMPQYNLGHVERIKNIRQLEATLPSLGLAGSAYEGVGIPQVINSGQVAAAQAIAELNPYINKSF
jgi:oxygen-dependent protoporphyrinogen oxidase